MPVVLATTGTVADNHAAEGRPKIVAGAGGTADAVAQVGTELSVDLKAIKDDDGRTNAVWSHQWIGGRKGIDSGTGKIDPYRAIPGANSADATYTPTTDDLGKLLKVRVSFTDGAGHVEHRISWAVGPIVAGSAQQSGSQGAGGNPIAGFTLFDNAAGGADVMALTDGAALGRAVLGAAQHPRRGGGRGGDRQRAHGALGRRDLGAHRGHRALCAVWRPGAAGRSRPGPTR